MFVYTLGTLRLMLVFTAVAVLAACASTDNQDRSLVELLQPYRIPVIQGNVVTREQLAVLKPGMSRIQVRDILGTPLLTSVFHGERWDYVFTLRRQGVDAPSRKVVVFFKNDLLERFEADAVPTEAEFVASLDSGGATGAAPILEAPAQALEQYPAPVRAATSKPLPPLPESYPPLESPSR
jgi:outer membrane protein assembly factor BamE